MYSITAVSHAINPTLLRVSACHSLMLDTYVCVMR